MALGRLATLAIVLLLGAGIATAYADEPPTTTTDPSPTTTTTATSTSTETTTTTAAETTTTTAASTTTTAASRPRTTPARAIPRGASLPETTLRESVPSTLHRHKKRRHRLSKPLEVTPPLGSGTYVFPVVGATGYGDTYGAPRGDVAGKWHHGDDLFAKLGTPVVAVADGTVNRVGWEKVGGWRLWVRDNAADEFYYAHLSGYAPAVFHSNRVEAGEVIGFVGNTGDAYTGVPHLHFEVHPRQLLRLRYGGAVDPTSYLGGWRHLATVQAPRPVHPRLPKQPLLRKEARHVFRELLVARGLIGRTPVGQPEIDFPVDLRDLTGSLQPSTMRQRTRTPAILGESDALAVALLAGLASVGVFAATMALLRLVRWRLDTS